MENKNRVLTLLIEIKNPDEAKWIWDSHSQGERNGIVVNGICNGDMFEERDKLEEENNQLEEKLNNYHL